MKPVELLLTNGRYQPDSTVKALKYDRAGSVQGATSFVQPSSIVSSNNTMFFSQEGAVSYAWWFVRMVRP